MSAGRRTGPGGQSSSPRRAPARREGTYRATGGPKSFISHYKRRHGHEPVKRAGLDVKGYERVRQRKHTGGSVCLAATGPNAISVSPNWRRRLLPEGKPNTPKGDIGRTPRAAEGTDAPSQTGDERTGNYQGYLSLPEPAVGCSTVRRVPFCAWHSLAPARTAATSHRAGASQQEAPQRLEKEGAADLPWWHEGTAPGHTHEYYGTGKTAVLQLEIVGHEWEFLVGPIPYEIILGIDWLVNHKVAWYFQPDKLRTYVNGRWCDLPVLRKELRPPTDAPATTEQAKTPANRAYDALAQQVARMTAWEAAALLRPPPKGYKSRHRAGDRVKIKDVLREARKDTAALERALEGLHFVAVLPEAEPGRVVHVPLERQGPLLCVIVEHYQATTREPDAKSAAVAAPAVDDTEDSPWPTAKLTYTEFDNWSRGHEALSLLPQILTVLQQHRLLFPDSLPDGLPPKRPYDHRILLLPGKLPTKAPIYKMPPDQLSYHTKEIARLTAKGWIGRTNSPICAPTIMVECSLHMVDKYNDGSGEHKMRVVVNYQALNTLTIAPEFPMPTVHTILEMLGGAKYFSTLDLEAGFHQIRMAKEDRWKTAFRSVQGLFEYKVMPFGLKDAPAT
ncbi:hypothetical protein EBH_0073740 [Eimeria brunetti]|uniref:Reverse transcriptase domain-containing protein n=1 Tax=Eimeria brunetti TaxID=51314 RepID=U6LGC0_9EIME|nr:hypothetical protein EBH_0073740 [Eimeria brunetti]